MTHKIAAVWWFYELQSWLLMTAIYILFCRSEEPLRHTANTDPHPNQLLWVATDRWMCVRTRARESHLKKLYFILFIQFRRTRTFFQYVSFKKNSDLRIFAHPSPVVRFVFFFFYSPSLWLSRTSLSFLKSVAFAHTHQTTIDESFTFGRHTHTHTYGVRTQ